MRTRHRKIRHAATSEAGHAVTLTEVVEEYETTSLSSKVAEWKRGSSQWYGPKSEQLKRDEETGLFRALETDEHFALSG